MRRAPKRRVLSTPTAHVPKHANGIARADTLPTIVLVHGAWLDGSCWMDVIARLQVRRLRVVSVQCPLTSLADDVAAVERVLERESGPVVLVGHGWGGTVITQVGVIANVIALVYVAAFVPDLAQSTNDVRLIPGDAAYASLLESDSGNFLWFAQRELPHWFAQDLPIPNAALLAATQRPIHADAFDDRVSNIAWKSRPAWYLVAEHDRMISPFLQHKMAERSRAMVHAVPSSHVPFLSQPKETTAIILAAAAMS